MAVAPKKSTETVETAVKAALAPMNQVQEQVREAAEKGVEQVKAQYEAVKEAAEKATGKIEESLTAAKTGATAFNVKAIELARKNANASFDHFQSLFAVKSVQDFVNLNTEFAKAQAAVFADQAKELSALGQKAVTDAVEPVKSAIVVPFQK